MSTPSRPSKAERREAAREKARQMREAVEARQRRNRRLVVVAAVAGVLAVVVGVGTLIQAGRSDVTETSAEPANFVDGGFVTGEAQRAPVVSVYYDYLCPACAQFEATTGPWLTEMRDAGEIALEYKPISILDRASSTEYSTRSANAAACVADSAPAAFVEFHDAMFAAQPAEGGAGLSDDEITSIAREAGAGDEVAQCIEDETFTGWVANTTDASSRAGVPGTPTVMVNDEIVQDRTQEGIQAAMDAARG